MGINVRYLERLFGGLDFGIGGCSMMHLFGECGVLTWTNELVFGTRDGCQNVPQVDRWLIKVLIMLEFKEASRARVGLPRPPDQVLWAGTVARSSCRAYAGFLTRMRERFPSRCEMRR